MSKTKSKGIDLSKRLISIEMDAAKKEYKQELAFKDATIKKYADALGETKKHVEQLLCINRSKRRDITIRHKSRSDNEATAFAVASDWHCEEVVYPENVNGMNEHNLHICKQKIDRFFNSIIKLTEINRHGIKVNNLVLGLLGDFITGYIHEELAEENALSPTRAIIWVLDRLRSGIKFLQEHGGFKNITIICCDGNHGRTTRKMRSSTRTDNSNEILLYQVLAREFPELTWHIADGYHVFQEVYGRTIRWHHGDAIQYQGGIGGITVSVNKAVSGWDKARTAHLDIFGHHHNYQQNPKWICNGSLIGYSPYSITIKAPFELPMQTYFLMDAKRGRTCTWPIHCL